MIAMQITQNTKQNTRSMRWLVLLLFQLGIANQLANALDMCAKDGSLGSAVLEHSWFESALVPVLLAAIKDAAGSASNAYAAALGLSSLLSSASATIAMVEGRGGFETLQMAHEFGLRNHDLLASEAARCLDFMKGTH